MNKISISGLLVVVLLLIPVSTLFAKQANEEKAEKSFNWEPIIAAIIEVESGGNPYAKSGSSVGVLQITPVLVTECNNILKRDKSKKRYSLKDRFSKERSKEMFLLFQRTYNPLNNVEKAIRSWNGGLRYKAKRTQRYFEKVMRVLNRINH